MSKYSNLTQNLAPETPLNQVVSINGTCGYNSLPILYTHTNIYIYMSKYSNLSQNLAPETPQIQVFFINGTCG